MMKADPSAAAAMAVAPEKCADPQPLSADIEYSILLRLPIKSLKRFHCVWPCFKPYMQSCLGLVCLFCRYCSQHILICNPSTQDLISLPTNKGSNVSIGFGFAASTQDFKVVRVYYGSGKYRCEVFTLGASGPRRWRQGRSPVNRVGHGCAPFLHGAVHFLPHVPYEGVNDTDRIIVFDIDSEEYREAIILPAYYYSLGDCEGCGILPTRGFLRFSKLGGSLCLTFDFGELRCYLQLWLLKDYDSVEWVKGYTIDVSTFFPSYFFWAYPTDTMGDDILLNCSDDKGVKILGYDPRDGTLSLKKDEEWAATFYVETFYRLRWR